MPNTAAGIRRRRLRPPEAAAVVEPTGRCGEAPVRAARAAGRTVLLAPPATARSFLPSEQSRAKTDRLDSTELALYGLTGQLRPYPLLSPAVDRVNQLLAARRGLSRSPAALRQQRAALPIAADALTPAIEALEHRVAARGGRRERALPAAAAGRGHRLAAVAALDAVPGFGQIRATAPAARLVGKQFAHPDQFVAYVGLDLRVSQSGRRRGQPSPSKRGDAELRRLLYLAAMSAANANRDRTFADRYAREVAKGLPRTAALNAVA